MPRAPWGAQNPLELGCQLPGTHRHDPCYTDLPMTTRFPTWLALGAALSFFLGLAPGCFNPVGVAEGPDKPPQPPYDASVPMGLGVLIGVPDNITGLEYYPLEDGDEMGLESFGQGGTHIVLAIRCVEFGDAAIIICSEEDGEQDVILIDTGENDADRIRAELIANGISLSGTPFDRFIVTHYDHDHMGDAVDLKPLSGIVYSRQ